MTRRTIEALKQLASRPGTSQEGAVARTKLRDAEKKHPHLFGRPPAAFVHIGFEDFRARCWHCPCGNLVWAGKDCLRRAEHEELRASIAAAFQKGDRVYYNFWAYEPNCPATVMGFPKPDKENWGWIRLRFDHLKASRNVPIHSPFQGLHLLKTPLAMFEALFLIKESRRPNF